MSLEARKAMYEESSIGVRDKHARKVRAKSYGGNGKISEKGLMLMKLIRIIPNWETYLTEKQLEAVKEYRYAMSIVDVSDRLKIHVSSADSRLFGDPNPEKKEKGALGRLMEAYMLLKKTNAIQK
jgi:hypothetical protein